MERLPPRLILSAAQLAAIVVALYGAALLAGLFSDRLLPVAEPFAGGYFEGQLDVVATELPDNDAGLSGEDWVAAHPDTAQEYAEQCFAGRRGAWPAPRSPCATSRTSRCAPP